MMRRESDRWMIASWLKDNHRVIWRNRYFDTREQAETALAKTLLTKSGLRGDRDYEVRSVKSGPSRGPSCCGARTIFCDPANW